MFGLDYISGPAIDAMKAANVGFVCRYLSQVNNLTEIKLLKADEAKSLSAAGIAIVSNYEWYASRALEGYAAGVADAQIAASQHTSCGGPGDRPIYFSVDQDVEGSQVADYFRGVASVIGLSRTGAYGSYRVIKYLLDQGLITWGWQTYAWSYGLWEDRAHIQQYSNGMYVGGASVDFNHSIKSDFGQWLIGEFPMIDLTTPGVSDYFEADGDTWKCKNGYHIRGINLQYYRQVNTGQSGNLNGLTVLGLPKSDEKNIDTSGNTEQEFERGWIRFDPQHKYDNPPGSGASYHAHLPAQTTAKGPDTSEAAAIIKALPTDAQRQAALTALGAQ